MIQGPFNNDFTFFAKKVILYKVCKVVSPTLKIKGEEKNVKIYTDGGRILCKYRWWY